MPPRFIARQLSHPSGWFAPIIGFLMNRNNLRLNRFALSCLAAGPEDRVVEVGFGGVTMPELVANAGHVIGVDRSPEIIEAAMSRYARAIKTGRADFREGSIEHLPLDTATVTKVLTVNTIYFWKSLDAGFAELARVLTAGGTAVIGFVPKSWMEGRNFPPDIFTPRTPEDVVTGLRAAGFTDVRIEKPNDGSSWLVALARKGPA